ncbi:coiled-coil and C2 domain containing 2A [Anticarsia gemmatalis]|uniref:coiled-coil and C2 domain containing 2A n=1 Tax=Anticarsia gemmatalis TaxID=129554 RepID=UPI003F76E1AE
MNENIELRTFTADNSTENDIQEYHEIKQDTTLDDVDTSFSSKQSSKPVNEYDFFTQYDVKGDNKKGFKKKKTKKKDKTSNLMDIISSELAANTVPLAENVITYVDNSKEHQSSYLQTSFSTDRLLRTPRSYFTDAETGRFQNVQRVNLSPIFPRVLENAVTEEVFIPVEYVQPYTFDDIIAQNSDKEQEVPTKFLDISIQNITFKHHHNFSLEKLLCMKVLEKYKEYEFVLTSLKDISKDIKVNRETKDNLKKDLAKVSPSKKDSLRFDQTVRKYTETLIKLKEKQRGLLKNKKELAHRIVSLWSDIEMVRERSDRIETPYTLELTKKILDSDEFEKEWNSTFNTEFTDKLDTIEFEYVNEYLEYKEAKTEQKSKKLSKPQLHIDEDAIKIEAEKLANNIIVKDEIELQLKRNESVLTDFVKLGLRLTKNSYHFEIYVDDVFVCESEHYSSNDMYCVEFTESFSVQILPKNSYIRILLLENGEKVSRHKITLADIKKSSSDFSVENLVYENDVEPTAKHVGSGHSIKEIAVANKVRLRSSSLFKEKLHTTCEINIKVGWNDKIEQNQAEAIKTSIEVGKQIKRLLNGTDKPTLDVLIDVISKIYEKDINDEDMIETLQKLSKMEITTDHSFAIDQNNPDLIRLKLLHLRNIGGFSNIDKKLVPLHASQISTEQLNCLQKTKEREFDMDYLNDKEMEMDPIELQRFIGAKYVQKLNKNMLRNLNEYLLQKTHKDVVRDLNFGLRSLFFNQSNVASLASLSSSAKQQLLTESMCKEQDIHVTVLRAFNLLDRSSTILEEGSDDEEKIAGFKIRPLRPYVRLNYRGVSAQTVTAIGCHPTWSHTLKIKTKLEPLSSVHINIFDEHKVQILEGFSEEDRSSRTVHYRYYNKWLGTLQIPLYTVLTLGTIRGTFKISTPPLLFGYETLQTKESSSLIPEITQLMKKDTSFITLEVTTSLSHLGGLHAYNQPLPSSLEDDYLIKHLNNFVTEYTNEFPMRNISLNFIDSGGRNKCVTQFLQPIPLPEKDFFPKAPRCESAVSKSSGLSKSSSSSGRRRELEGERVNQEERESLYSGTMHDGDSLSKMINACLRYVSLIPSYEVVESHVVTLLGLELLKVLHGSPLDHNILLASYFIYLGIKCWIAIGLGLPRGPSSYVLIKYDLTTRRIVLDNDQLFRSKGFLNRTDGYTWYVCDASNGQKYELRDVGCPLKTVDYVFDNENIWVNMQMSQDCESMSFDFTRSSEWQPVFDKTVFVMKQPVVTDHALYSSPPNVEALRAALETKIKAKIQKWRSHMKTIWNRYCSTLLREMLPQWEYWSFNPSGQKPGFSHRLKQLMVTYKMYGFPLNMSYTNTKSVISAVKSTGLHVIDDPKVEFALAVEVYAYPNNVISLWAFLVTITRM